MYVSSTYADADARAQHWADYFASLMHGRELQSMTAYVVPPAEIAGICGTRALGCYGSDRLAFVGETFHGVPAEEVAAHEYGHHVAWNRLNPPWVAIDVGPKRWASAVDICARTQQGLAFPGDQGANYTRNPAEGWAEVYRVLSELRRGATSFVWSLVDPLFSPDQVALWAAEQDVLAPWTAPTTKVFRGRFRTSGTRVWSASLPTPLDGVISATLTIPRGAVYDLTILAPGERTPVATSLWSGVVEKRATATVCGQRSIVLRVTQRIGSGRFVLRVTHD